MSEWKKRVMTEAMKAMTDPRVAKVLSDERVMKAMTAAVALPSRVSEFAKMASHGVASALDFATHSEVRDLRRTVRDLEDKVQELSRTSRKD